MSYQLIPSPEFASRERQLWTELPSIVGAISLAEVAVLASAQTLSHRRRIAPPDITDYRLVPLMRKDSTIHMDTITGARSAIQFPEGVRNTWHEPEDNPWMDSGVGVGLTHLDDLIAFADFGQYTDGTITINQIHGKSFAPSATQAEKRPLFRNLIWRPTLVRAIGRVAKATNAPALRVLGGGNIHWANIAKPGDLYSYQQVLSHRATCHAYAMAYDKVAMDMGFVREADGNWLHSPIPDNLVYSPR